MRNTYYVIYLANKTKTLLEIYCDYFGVTLSSKQPNIISLAVQLIWARFVLSLVNIASRWDSTTKSAFLTRTMKLFFFYFVSLFTRSPLRATDLHWPQFGVYPRWTNVSFRPSQTTSQLWSILLRRSPSLSPHVIAEAFQSQRVKSEVHDWRRLNQRSPTNE